MDIKYLEAFLKVCDLGSFTAAADALNLSQPGVSKQIQRLETSLGITLLRRDDNGIQLTEVGRQVYHSAKTMVAEWNTLMDTCRSTTEQLSGLLRIGASTIPAKHLLPNIIAKFHAAHPLVELSVSVSDSRQVLEQLYRGSIEVAYVGLQPEHPDVHSLPLSSDSLVVISDKAKPSGLALTDFPFVLREAGSGTRIASEKALSRLGIEPDKIRCSVEVSDIELIFKLVEAGVGLSMVSSLDAERFVKDGRVTVIETLQSNRQFYLAYMRDTPHHSMVEAFIKTAQAQP